MSIPSYVRPQLTIEQILQVLPAASINRLTPIVLGPQYLLNRYNKEVTPGEEFLSAGLSLSYKYTDSLGVEQLLPASHTVDLEGVSFWGEDLEAEYAYIPDSGATNAVHIESLARPDIIRIDTVTFAGGTLDPLFAGRDMEVGDLMYIDDGNRIVKRTVI